MATPGTRGTRLGRRGLRLPDLRHDADDAGTLVGTCGRADRHRRRRRDRRTVLMAGWEGGDYLDRPLRDLLSDIAGAEPVPAAGSTVAGTTALAAARSEERRGGIESITSGRTEAER